MTANQKQPGRVITFYSYKGGVGRSMALANVAALLAKWGQDVLVIDWDLEAPGIDKYFKKWLEGGRKRTDGIADLVCRFNEGSPASWKDCLLEVRPPGAKTIHVISAGRDDGEYTRRVQEIDWDGSFERGFGNELERWRNEWIADYDFVLVDSRTGISDIGGLCAIHLPDVLVAFFTATAQSLDGTADVLHSAREAHAALEFDRRRLLVVPVPSRDETGSEEELARTWRHSFADRLGEYFGDWLPKDEDATTALNYLKIPYKAYWSFGERIPVLEEEDADSPKSFAYAYHPLGRLLLGRLDWDEVQEGAQASEEAARLEAEAERLRFESLRASEIARERESERRKSESERQREAFERQSREYLQSVEARAERWLQIALHNKNLAARSWFGGITGIAASSLLLSPMAQVQWRMLVLPGGELKAPPVLLAVGVIGTVAFALSAAFFAFARPSVRSRIAMRCSRQLQREMRLFETAQGAYAGDPTEGLERFVATVEEIENVAHYAMERRREPGAWGLFRDRADSSRATPRVEASARPPARDREEGARREAPTSDTPYERDYRYDVFISYRRDPLIADWTDEFQSLFSYWLGEELGREARVFRDETGLSVGSDFADELGKALLHSRLLIPIWTPSYFGSGSCMAEFQSFVERERIASPNIPLIYPLLFHGRDRLPPNAQGRKYLDVTRFAFTGAGFRQTALYVEFQEEVRRIAERVARGVQEAPPYSDEFPLVPADRIEEGWQQGS